MPCQLRENARTTVALKYDPLLSGLPYQRLNPIIVRIINHPFILKGLVVASE